MLTKFSKWILYTVSYLPVYFTLALRQLFTEQKSVDSLEAQILLNCKTYRGVIIALVLLFIFSVFVACKLHSYRPSERVYKKLTKNVTGEMASFFIPYILSILLINFDSYGLFICILIFLLCGVVIIQADWLKLCPIFFYAGYKLYVDENSNYILSRLKIEQFNQILLDEVNGIEATPLTPRLFIVTRKSF